MNIPQSPSTAFPKANGYKGFMNSSRSSCISNVALASLLPALDELGRMTSRTTLQRQGTTPAYALPETTAKYQDMVSTFSQLSLLSHTSTSSSSLLPNNAFFSSSYAETVREFSSLSTRVTVTSHLITMETYAISIIFTGAMARGIQASMPVSI